jgi:hypothetical protein
MENKKTLINENEVKRILKLHKDKINEERKKINEADSTNLWGNVSLAAGTGALAGATILPGVGAIPGAIIGTIAGGLLAYFGTAGGKSFDRSKEIFKFCRTNKKDFTSPTMSSQELKSIASSIYKSIEGIGTNEDLLAESIKRCKNIVDFCNVTYVYYNTYGMTMFDHIDGDIDTEEEWNVYVLQPLLTLTKNTKVVDKDELLKKAKKCGHSSIEDYKKSGWKCSKSKLSNDEKLRKAKKCGHETWEEYKSSGWKCVKSDSGGGSNDVDGGEDTAMEPEFDMKPQIQPISREMFDII